MSCHQRKKGKSPMARRVDKRLCRMAICSAMRVVSEAESLLLSTKKICDWDPSLSRSPPPYGAYAQDCCTYGCYLEDRVFLKLLAILVSELVKSHLFQHVLPHFALTGARSDFSQMTD